MFFVLSHIPYQCSKSPIRVKHKGVLTQDYWQIGKHEAKLVLKTWSLVLIRLVELLRSRHEATDSKTIPANAATSLNWGCLVEENTPPLPLDFLQLPRMDCSFSYILPGHRLTLTSVCAIFLNKYDNAQTIALPVVPTPQLVAELRPRQHNAHIRAYRRWTRLLRLQHNQGYPWERESVWRRNWIVAM